MTARHAFLTTVAAAHLILVICGAAGFLSEERALGWYGEVSGAGNEYGFFAPGVGASYQATFTMTDEDGRTWTDDLDRGDTHEVMLRYNNGFSALDGLGSDLAASWAATMFGRHPQAQQVTVQFQEYDPPSMEEYRAGNRAEWKTFYQGTFVRESQASEGK
jgi:hypothetical protein